MNLYGISNHSPQQVIDFLSKRKHIKSEDEISILPHGTLLKPKKAQTEFLFVVSVSDLFRNLETLNSEKYNGVKVFLFASPLRTQEIRSCISLDTRPDAENRELITQFLPEIDNARYLSGTKVEVHDAKRLSSKFLVSLIDTIKAGSLLTPLMTFIYTLPSSTHQTPIKQLCARYFYEGFSQKEFFTKLDNLPDLKCSNRVNRRLEAILKSEPAQRYFSFFNEYRKAAKDSSKVNIESLCKRHGTTPYEVRYILSVISEVEKRTIFKGKTVAKIAKAEYKARVAKKLSPKEKKSSLKKKPAFKTKAKLKSAGSSASRKAAARKKSKPNKKK